MRAIALGVHVLDILVRPVEAIPEGQGGRLVEQIRVTAAGSAGGTALVLARLRAEVRSAGAIGTDAAGDMLLSLLGARASTRPPTSSRPATRGSSSGSAPPSPASTGCCPTTSRCFTGEDDLAAGCRALLARGVGGVAATRGADGAVVVTADGVAEVPAFPVDVVDTTGCGDAFSAGFLRGLSLGVSPADAARLGCATAAEVAQGLGTDAGSYDLARVRARI